MILNTTYYEKEHKSLLQDIVGKSFSFWQALRLYGIGSKRMIISTVSPNLQQYLNKTSDLNYANIELRPYGILVHINKGLNNYTWAIPFSQLHIYKTKGISIHAQGKFIQFKNNRMLKENKKFFEKIMLKRIEFLNHYNLPI